MITLDDLERCFGGAIPAVMATADGDGVPNVTYVSRAHRVDDERLALSNQFLSKTSRNIAVNPRACLLLIDPVTHDEYRLKIVYERTERRGPVFERLRDDIDLLAVVHQLQNVFRLRSADIYRVVDIEQVPANPAGATDPGEVRGTPDLGALAEVISRIARSADLDTLVDATLSSLDQLLGFAHVHVLLLDEDGSRLYTIGSRGFDEESIGAEVAVGDGVLGTVAAQCRPVRLGNLRQMAKYSAAVRRGFEEGGVRPGREVPVPGLALAESRIAVPAMARGELIGVLAADSDQRAAFSAADEQALTVVATTLASAIEHLRAIDDDDPAPAAPVAPIAAADLPVTTVRFFPVDGSTFFDNEYVIKGVAGRIVWALLRGHVTDGRTDFTNKELRLDRTIDLPGFKDNLESRLILLKRRLDERDAPLRIERTGRGRFALRPTTRFRLIEEGTPSPTGAVG